MFVLCPHCQFLVALDAASGRPPVRCPRCQAALIAASTATPGATEPTPAQATDLDDDPGNRPARGTGAPAAELAAKDEVSGPLPAAGNPQAPAPAAQTAAAGAAAEASREAAAAAPADDAPPAPPVIPVPSGEPPQPATMAAGTMLPDRGEVPGPLPDAPMREPAADSPTAPAASGTGGGVAHASAAETAIAATAAAPEPKPDSESEALAEPAPPAQGKLKRRARAKPESTPASTADDDRAPPVAGFPPPATAQPEAEAEAEAEAEVDADADAGRADPSASAPQPKAKTRRRRKAKPPAPEPKPAEDPAAAVVPHTTRRPARPAPSFVRRPASGSGIAPRRDWRALAAIAALLLVLAIQLLVAGRAQLAADPRWRPGMVALCRAVGCALPAWREPAAFTLLQRDVRAHPTVPGALRVTATFRNDARWAQAWPRIVLTLSDVDGRTAGMRAFEARDYLPRGATRKELPSGQSASLRLDVLEPSPRIVAFSFDFR